MNRLVLRRIYRIYITILVITRIYWHMPTNTTSTTHYMHAYINLGHLCPWYLPREVGPRWTARLGAIYKTFMEKSTRDQVTSPRLRLPGLHPEARSWGEAQQASCGWVLAHGAWLGSAKMSYMQCKTSRD